MTQSSRAVPETGVDSGVASASVRPEPIDVAAWRQAMEGVPDCQWHHTENGEVYVDERQQVCCGRGNYECCGQPDVTGDYYALANTSATTAPWIARCSPAGISTLLDALSAKDRELAEARAEIERQKDLVRETDMAAKNWEGLWEIRRDEALGAESRATTAERERDEAMAALREKEERVKALEEALFEEREMSAGLAKQCEALSDQIQSLGADQ